MLIDVGSDESCLSQLFELVSEISSLISITSIHPVHLQYLGFILCYILFTWMSFAVSSDLCSAVLQGSFEYLLTTYKCLGFSCIESFLSVFTVNTYFKHSEAQRVEGHYGSSQKKKIYSEVNKNGRKLNFCASTPEIHVHMLLPFVKYICRALMVQ